MGSRHWTRYEVAGHIRCLTFSCFHRLTLFSNDAIKDVFAGQLERTRASGCFELFGWVLMPEHVHLLIRPCLPEFPVNRSLRVLKEPVARRVLTRWRELDAPILARLHDKGGRTHFWQCGGGYDRNIVSENEYLEKLEYMHSNPVTRQLVSRADD